MAIGERINYLRNHLGMTQKYLGLEIGFPVASADVRIAQYETGSRTPKAEITAAIADALGVAPEALNVPDIDSYIGLMHTLFALEDIYGLTIDESDGEICIKLNKENKDTSNILPMLSAWKEQANMLRAGKIDGHDYNKWRYKFPKYDNTQKWVKIPIDLSDELK